MQDPAPREVGSWLGRAQLAAGQSAQAIDTLEHSLWTAHQSCDGFDYYVPLAEIALAQALWDTGGDKARAGRLAAHARDGFTRVGRGREPDRDRAIAWLAAHPEP